MEYTLIYCLNPLWTISKIRMKMMMVIMALMLLLMKTTVILMMIGVALPDNEVHLIFCDNVMV